MDLDVKRVRQAARMSQAALAGRTGLEWSRLSFQESGYLTLKADEEAAIRREVGRGIDYALGAVVHCWAQFSLAVAVDGLWITRKKWMNFFLTSGLADALMPIAAVSGCGDVNRRPA